MASLSPSGTPTSGTTSPAPLRVLATSDPEPPSTQLDAALVQNTLSDAPVPSGGGIASTEETAGDVIVVDDGEETTAPSPGRTSARIKAKKVARALRTANRKPKRVGPVSATDLAEARRKKRKAVTAPSSAPEPSTHEMHPPLSSGLLATNPVSTTAAPQAASTRNATLNSACEGAPSDDVRAPYAVPTAVSSARSGDAGQTRLHDEVGPTAESVDVPPLNSAVLASGAERVPPQVRPLDLEEFNRSIPVPAYEATPCTTPVPNASLEAKVNQLFDQFNDLRRAIQHQGSTALPSDMAASVLTSAGTLPNRADSVPTALDPSSGSTRAPYVDTPGLWTLPTTITGADMPLAAICQLRCTSFELHRARVKGEYAPPQAHQLAAHRLFRDLSSDAGKWWSSMSFVLRIRELDCVRFDAPPAVLMALYSGRLGSRGLTVMHFRPLAEAEQLRRGSTNANVSTDFGAGASLPATDAQSATYDALLTSIGGLISFGDALWFDYARRLLSRLKRFVQANSERDANNTPERVTLTLDFVNKFLGRALTHLVADSPHWWRDYNEAVRAVDYQSSEWQAALYGLALRMATSTPKEGDARQSSQLRQQTQPRRGPATRTPIMPDHLRRQIPRDRDGREPCLGFMAGGMCYGGSRERCAHHRRTHHWDGHLPRELQDYIDNNYGTGRRQHDYRNHA